MLRFGELVLDVPGRSVSVAGTPVDLTRREFDLLVHLALAPDRTFSRAELLEGVWGSSELHQSATTVTEHLRRIRNRIAEAGGDLGCIETVRGVGYRFVSRPEGEPMPRPLVQAVLEHHETVELFVDRDGVVVQASEGALDFFGALSDRELVRQPITELVAPSSLDALRRRADAARAGEWPEPEDLLWRRLDGCAIAAEVVSTPACLDDADVARLTLWPTGVRQSELLQSVIAGISTEVPDAVIVTTPDLKIRSFNPAAERLYGWREEEVRGRLFTDVVPWLGQPEELDAARKHLRAAGSWRGRARQRCRDGSAVTVLGTITTLVDAAGRPYGIIAVNRAAASVRVRDEAVTREELVRAADAGRIVPHYQPFVRLHDGRLYGFEALARWERGDGETWPAARFIADAERFDVVERIGDRILDLVLADVSDWNAEGLHTNVAVNLSAAQLSDHLVQTVRERVRRGQVDARQLWFEVTETSLIEDIDVAAQALHGLAELGCRVSIDDFGTGWASLTYLRRFPISGLKIDRTFVHGLGGDGQDEVIVRSVLRLARELSLASVAEGIETEGQARVLRQLGCVFGQGFLYGAAEPSGTAAFEARLRTSLDV